ncbi:Bax inhibitor-1/YccA family protein [Clostridium gasigenes]|uniref:Bax inhibitor-1/YccA family protein n=1 Tax=Clostridium gasigenes TaxID=94869 RepID=A0A7X0SDI9_9CLOT|nr:Bax inhibitor-1/YccA family protein [Clostridium gasigenes]MBB6715602.1 Bax inhibitor-1/YccA family protein [Clostridium gasigenes]
MIKNGNPFLEKGFKNVTYQDNSMTVGGTVLKTMVLLALVGFSFIYSWLEMGAGIGKFTTILGIAVVIAFISSLVTAFIPKISPITAPIYAVSEGILLGYISKLADLKFPGIVVSAILLTLALTLATLLIYRRNPAVAGKITRGVMIATFGVFLTYLVTFVLGFFGISLPIFGSGPIGILFSVAVIVIATLNLIVDYDFILKNVSQGAPKYMEWYSAYGLMVTLVWLYIEILRLLTKLKSDD